eukprot:bmy_10371T0
MQHHELYSWSPVGTHSVVTFIKARLIAFGFCVFSTYINHVWRILISDPTLDLDIQELASLTTGGGDLENFERLFSKLKEMKACLINMESCYNIHAFQIVLRLLDEFLKIYFPPRQGCDASSRAKKVACRKGEKISQVAKAFWMAIGGDRDEIEGLSSDEEH